MMLYWNFLLEREGIAYYRVRYNLLNIFEKVGGLMSCITVAMFYLMKPCYYKKHAMTVLREYEKKGLCRDVNHATVRNQLPLDISPIRLFLYDVKLHLLSTCKRKDPDDDDEEEETPIDIMKKKMVRVNKDNMDIINIMKIDRIEQSLDTIKLKSGEKSNFQDKRKRKMSVAASSVSHSSQMMLFREEVDDKKPKMSRIDSLFGNNNKPPPLRRNKTTGGKKETEMTKKSQKAGSLGMKTLSEGSEESSQSSASENGEIPIQLNSR